MPTMSGAELKVLSLAWHCFETMPKVDYKKLADLGGYKTAASATSAYLAARKKLLAGTNSPLQSKTPKNTPVKTNKRKAGGQDSDEDETESLQPKKKARSRKPKTQAETARDEVEDGGEMEEQQQQPSIKPEPTPDSENEESTKKLLAGINDYLGGPGTGHGDVDY